MHSDDVSPWLIRGVYLFGIALILHAVIDLSTTVWPFRITEMTWRYGFLGLGAGYLQTPTLGLLLIAATALWNDDRGIARVVSLIFMAGSLVLIVAAGLFMLDVLQVRQLRPSEAATGVLYGGLFQGLKYVLAALIIAALGHGIRDSLRTAALSVRAIPQRGPLIGEMAKAAGVVERGVVRRVHDEGGDDELEGGDDEPEGGDDEPEGGDDEPEGGDDEDEDENGDGEPKDERDSKAQS